MRRVQNRVEGGGKKNEEWREGEEEWWGEKGLGGGIVKSIRHSVSTVLLHGRYTW